MIAILLDAVLVGAALAALARRVRDALRTRTQQRLWHEFLAGHGLSDEADR